MSQKNSSMRKSNLAIRISTSLPILGCAPRISFKFPKNAKDCTSAPDLEFLL
jgi:hypothetical protein